MKKAIAIILLSTFVIGCSDNSSDQIQGNNEQVSANGATENSNEQETDNMSDIDKIKFYAQVMRNYGVLEHLNSELNGVTQDLYNIAVEGYHLNGYEEGIKNLDLFTKIFSKVSTNIKETIESSESLMSIRGEYKQDLTNMKVAIKHTKDAMEEHRLAYEQIELYIKTDDNKHIEKYRVHADKVYDLTLQAKSVAVESENNFYGKIIDY